MLLAKPFPWALDIIPSHTFNDIVSAILFFLHYKSSPFPLAKSNWLAKNAVLSSNLIKSILTVISPLLFSFYTAKLMERVVCVKPWIRKLARGQIQSMPIFYVLWTNSGFYIFKLVGKNKGTKDKGRRTRRKVAATVHHKAQNFIISQSLWLNSLYQIFLTMKNHYICEGTGKCD